MLRPSGRHLVHFVAFADGVSLPLVGIDDLGRQGLLHRNALARVGQIDQPAHRQRELPVGGHFHRHLVGGAANPPGLDLEARLHIVHGPLQDFHWIAAGILLRDLVERAVHDPLGKAFLATLHDRADQARNQRAVEFGVFHQRSLYGSTSSGHRLVKLLNR